MLGPPSLAMSRPQRRRPCACTTRLPPLAGMLQATSGTAFVNGSDIRTQMDVIRQSLGICPQFDVLWPDLTVRCALPRFPRQESAGRR